MINVFPAIRAIYECHPVLRKYGRKLREGPDSREHPPDTVVDAQMVEDLSTFGAIGTGLDVRRWVLTFTLESDSMVPNGARRWIQAMRDAFVTANIIDPVFTAASCSVVDQVGPIVEDEFCKAATVVELITQEEYLMPLTRS